MLEVGAEAVHLVDEAQPRHVVAVGLAPDGLGLGLDAADAAEDRHRPVQHAQADRSTSMVKSTWPGVSMRLIVWSSPLAGGGGRGDGDAPLLLLGQVVHDGRAVVDLADLVASCRRSRGCAR